MLNNNINSGVLIRSSFKRMQPNKRELTTIGSSLVGCQHIHHVLKAWKINNNNMLACKFQVWKFKSIFWGIIFIGLYHDVVWLDSMYLLTYGDSFSWPQKPKCSHFEVERVNVSHHWPWKSLKLYSIKELFIVWFVSLVRAT